MARTSMVATLAVTLALVCAPAAAAVPDDDTRCGKRGGASGCQRPGHSSLHVEPKPLPTGPAAGLMRPDYMPGYGGAPMPVID